jgi:hypothetical protein
LVEHVLKTWGIGSSGLTRGCGCCAQTHTPVYLSWIKKISYVAYGYSGLVKNEFEGLQIFTAQGMQVGRPGSGESGVTFREA